MHKMSFFDVGTATTYEYAATLPRTAASATSREAFFVPSMCCGRFSLHQLVGFCEHIVPAIAGA
jgi:hypothetical protein